jgi:diguanylate cyclase (GGDEF)-like protein
VRDPRFVEIELLMDVDIVGPVQVQCGLRAETSYAQIGSARKQYGLDPARFHSLVIDLIREDALVNMLSRRDDIGMHEGELLQHRSNLLSVLTSGRPSNVFVGHTGRVRMWTRRDELLRNPDVEPMGLLSKAAWERALPLHLQFASEDEPLTIIFADLDNFGHVNKQLGHGVGDKVLRVTFDLVKNLVGHRGQVYRFGGEEIGILLPKTRRDDGRKIAAELLSVIAATVRSQVTELDRDQTASIGVATFTDRCDPAAALALVDKLNRQAKDAGKNRVVADA